MYSQHLFLALKILNKELGQIAGVAERDFTPIMRLPPGSLALEFPHRAPPPVLLKSKTSPLNFKNVLTSLNSKPS